MSNTDIGTLYVLANRDNSLAKVGLTRNGTPNARATDYERQHGIQWRVYWHKLTCNVTDAESSAHRELADQRFALVPGAREIFHITPAKAVAVAERYVVPPKTEEPLIYERAERERIDDPITAFIAAVDRASRRRAKSTRPKNFWARVKDFFEDLRE